MRVLVAGAHGQVARSLVAHPVGAGVTVIARGRPQLDLTSTETIAAVIDDSAPDIIINAAAYTVVDQAETETAEAHALNEHGAAALARVARGNDIPLIHISTDYVFDGRSDQPYRETDAVAPMSAYGRSKLAGEHAVAAAQPQSLIIRTAWVISPYGRNFCKTMLRLARERRQLRVVSDQIGSPTYAPHLAAALIAVAQHGVSNRDSVQWGTYHLANHGFASWHDVAVATMREAGRNGLANVAVEAITTAEYPTPARRPQNSRLDCAKALDEFGLALPPWQDGVAACVAAIAQGDHQSQ